MASHKVFVYGTLKRGLGNHHLLKDSRFLGVGYTGPRFVMLGGGFPVLVWPKGAGPRQRHVSGELYEVDDATMKRLDQLEAVGSMYDRYSLPVTYVADGQQERLHTDAHLYVGRDDCWLDVDGGYKWNFYDKINQFGDLDWRPSR